MAFNRNTEQKDMEGGDLNESSSSGSFSKLSASFVSGVLSTPPSIDSTSLELESCPRLLALDLSLQPRVHSTKRISPQNHVLHHMTEQLFNERKPDLITNTPNECTLPKLSAPGSSVVVHGNVNQDAEPEPLPVVDPDRLCPYPPGQIVVVTERPGQADPAIVPVLSDKPEPCEDTEATVTSPPCVAESVCQDRSELINVDAREGRHAESQEVCQCGSALEGKIQALWRCQAREVARLRSELDVCAAERDRWEKEAAELAHESGSLRTRVNEQELELAVRSASIQSLKSKVAQQHVDAAELSQQKRRLERDTSANQHQLEETRRMEQWYRDQLHACQAERTTLQQELMVAREAADREMHRADRLQADLAREQDRLREEAARQKGGNLALMRQLQAIISANQPAGELPGPAEDQVVDQAGQAELKELHARVSDLEHSLAAARSGLDAAEQENARRLQRALELQRELADCRQRLQAEADRCRSAETDRDSARAALKARETTVSELSAERAALASRLEAAEREHAGVEEAMGGLNRNYTNLSSQYRSMKAELQTLRKEREEAEQRREGERRAEQETMARATAEWSQREALLSDQRDQNASRLSELTQTLQTLEAEMSRLQARHTDSGELRGKIDSLTASLEEASACARNQAASLHRDMERLRAQNAALREDKAALQRARLELSERAQQLESWLDAVTQGERVGLRMELISERLAALRASPVEVHELEAAGDAGDRESARPESRPDLLTSAQPAVVDPPQGPQGPAEDVPSLRALLEECVARASALPASGQIGAELGADQEVVLGLLADLERHLGEHRRALDKQSGDGGDVRGEVLRLEQELSSAQATIKELHKQLFQEKRDGWQLRKEVSSLRMGLETANDMLDNNKIALGRSETYGQLLETSKTQLEDRLEAEQREHEDCRARLERLSAELQEARAKDPLLAAQLKTLSCHLHQRSGELRALQVRLELQEAECANLRVQMNEQREAAYKERDLLQTELLQAQQDLAHLAALVENRAPALPTPTYCDEETLNALIERSNRLPRGVMAQLQRCVDGLKAEVQQLQELQQLDGILCNHQVHVI